MRCSGGGGAGQPGVPSEPRLAGPEQGRAQWSPMCPPSLVELVDEVGYKYQALVKEIRAFKVYYGFIWK